jgi:hypothetical protein
MEGKRFSEEQILMILNEAAAGATAVEVCSRCSMSPRSRTCWQMYGPPRLARLKMMIETALHQCIRPLASGLVHQPGHDEIRIARWTGTHARMPAASQPTLAGDVGAVLLGAPQGPFLCLRPIRRSALWIVERPATMPQRRCSSPWSSASVRSGVASTSRRRSASWGPSTRRRCPAARIELPRSTARTMRRRRFMAIGAGMAKSRLVSTDIVESQGRFYAIGKLSR